MACDEDLLIEGPDGKIATHSAGQGSRALVLLAGGPGLSADYLDPLLALAGSSLRVIRYDTRGVGGSPWPEPARFTLADLAADLEAVRRAYGLDRFDLLAHSWGGLVAWEYLHRYFGAVASLVLVGAMSPDEAADRRAQLRLSRSFARSARAGYIDAAPRRDATARFVATLPAYFHDPLMPVPEALLATELSERVRDAALAQVSRSPTAHHRAAAARFTGPSLVIMGESDPLGVELAEASVMALAGSAARLAIIPNAGHFPWLESREAAERFVALVRSFVRA